MFRFFILLHQISLFPNLEIHVSTNYYQVPTKVDEVSKARGVFLDISKAFDKVWHKWFSFKLKEKGITGDLLQILSEFFNNNK